MNLYTIWFNNHHTHFVSILYLIAAMDSKLGQLADCSHMAMAAYKTTRCLMLQKVNQGLMSGLLGNAQSLMFD